MAAPKGHPRWGNPLNTKELTPEEVWEGACEYFKWCNDNPWFKEQWVGKDAQHVTEELQRPYSLEALATHLNVDAKTLWNYGNREGYETYFPILSRIKQIIDSQHFEGGMVGAFNASLSARKLGLVDKQEVENKGTVIVWKEEKTYEAKPKADNNA